MGMVRETMAPCGPAAAGVIGPRGAAARTLVKPAQERRSVIPYRPARADATGRICDRSSPPPAMCRMPPIPAPPTRIRD